MWNDRKVCCQKEAEVESYVDDHSGKSSLLLTLFRVLEISNGRILIDGLDLAKYSRQTIRERLNTILQAPFFIKGSVKETSPRRRVFPTSKAFKLSPR
jgi:ABC-type cobalamin/Fe3+-siderophores transport system ATPase subunit